MTVVNVQTERKSTTLLWETLPGASQIQIHRSLALVSKFLVCGEGWGGRGSARNFVLSPLVVFMIPYLTAWLFISPS